MVMISSGVLVRRALTYPSKTRTNGRIGMMYVKNKWPSVRNGRWKREVNVKMGPSMKTWKKPQIERFWSSKMLLNFEERGVVSVGI